MERSRRLLEKLRLPQEDPKELPHSNKRFPDGALWRVEIPSVEGPEAFREVLRAAELYEVPVHRVSQGSGIMLLRDGEIAEMAAMGRDHDIEVCLFVGPRAAFDIGGQVRSEAGRSLGMRHAGMDQLRFALDDVFRACDLGIRSVLAADEGLLWLIQQAKALGDLPENLVVKTSVAMGAANPVSIRLLESLGAGSVNVPGDLSLHRLAAIRQVVDVPLDLYVESPDDYGGFVRLPELPDLVRVCAPIYIKFGLRNAPNVYPSGKHLEDAVIRMTHERVRRAGLGVETLRRCAPELLAPADR